MSNGANDIAPIVPISDVEKAARANPGKAVMLYVTGMFPSGPCPHCVEFDASMRPTLEAHRQSSALYQYEVPFSVQGFTDLATALGGTFDPVTKTITDNGVTFSCQTPTLLQVRMGADGKLQVLSVAQGMDLIKTDPQGQVVSGADGNPEYSADKLDAFLKAGEQKATALGQSASAAGLNRTGAVAPQVADAGKPLPLQPVAGASRSQVQLG